MYLCGFCPHTLLNAYGSRFPINSSGRRAKQPLGQGGPGADVATASVGSESEGGVSVLPSTRQTEPRHISVRSLVDLVYCIDSDRGILGEMLEY